MLNKVRYLYSGAVSDKKDQQGVKKKNVSIKKEELCMVLIITFYAISQWNDIPNLFD